MVCSATYDEPGLLPSDAALDLGRRKFLQGPVKADNSPSLYGHPGVDRIRENQKKHRTLVMFLDRFILVLAL